MAQHPYNSDAIQASETAVVEELRALSDLKQTFLNKELDNISPQVTLMFGEIQEQQSLTRTYEITMKKLGYDVGEKESEIASLREKLRDRTEFNKSLEKKLNSTRVFSMLDEIKFNKLNPTRFVQVLHFSLRSARGFVKLMIKEMESAKWDLDEAAKIIEPGSVFAKSHHKFFAFESFVIKTMLEGFNSHDFGLTNDPEQYFDTFKDTNSLHPDDPKIVVLKFNVWRVKGIIQISRSIDDVYLKKAELNREPLYTKFLLREPMKRPILSADPSISVHELQPHDQFVIFASDGLWEYLSNEEAVNIVHKHARSGSAKRLVKAALQEAAKKREMRYSDLKKIDRGVRRHFHDDIVY